MYFTGALLKAAFLCAEIVLSPSSISLSKQLMGRYNSGFELHTWSNLPHGSGRGLCRTKITPIIVGDNCSDQQGSHSPWKNMKTLKFEFWPWELEKALNYAGGQTEERRTWEKQEDCCSAVCIRFVRESVQYFQEKRGELSNEATHYSQETTS